MHEQTVKLTDLKSNASSKCNGPFSVSSVVLWPFCHAAVLPAYHLRYVKDFRIFSNENIFMLHFLKDLTFLSCFYSVEIRCL